MTDPIMVKLSGMDEGNSVQDLQQNFFESVKFEFRSVFTEDRRLRDASLIAFQTLPVAPTVSAGKASVVVQGRSRRECWTALSGSSSASRRTREVELLPQSGPHRVRLVVAPAGPRFQNALENGSRI